MSARRSAALVLAALLAWAGSESHAQEEAPPGRRTAEAAREAAREDRNPEAAALFARALAEDPALRREVLREYADQLTYSGRAREAVPLYREVLAYEEDPRARRWTRLGLALALSWSGELREAQREYEVLIAEDAGEVDARLGRARVLVWQDRLGEAEAEYRRVLAANPQTLEARRELARVRWWRARPREARARIRTVLDDHPDDAESRLLLAEVQADLGRPDLALAALRALPARARAGDRPRALEAELLRRARPAMRAHGYAARQSNGVELRATGVEQRVAFADGRAAAELRYELHRLLPDAGEGVRVHRPGVHARLRASAGLELNAGAHAALIRPAGVEPERTEPLLDAWATLWPHDVLRVDLSARRALFDDVESVRRGITGSYAGVSADLTPSERTRLGARANLGRISDGNRRRWGQVEGEHRVWNHPRVLAGARLTAIDFRESTGHGYWEPQDFRAAQATLRAYDRLGGRLWWDVEGSFGREDSRDTEPRPSWSAGARIVWRAASATEVEARYHYFSSLADASGGFARGAFTLGVRQGW